MFSTVVVDVGRPRRRARANQVQAFRSRHRIRSRVASQVVRGVLGQSRSADSSDGPAKRSPLATVAAGTRGSLDPKADLDDVLAIIRHRTLVHRHGGTGKRHIHSAEKPLPCNGRLSTPGGSESCVSPQRFRHSVTPVTIRPDESNRLKSMSRLDRVRGRKRGVRNRTEAWPS